MNKEHNNGISFILEHPQGSESWKWWGKTCAQTLQYTSAAFDKYMVWPEGPESLFLSKKTTRIMSNIPKVGFYLGRKCTRGHEFQPIKGSTQYKSKLIPEYRILAISE